jgi:O-antigen/teichoic acid export membrane protein
VSWFNLQEFSPKAVLLILALGALQLCFETLRGFMAGVLYSAGSYGLAYNVAAGAKLVELISAIFAVGVLGARPVGLAALTAVIALIDLIIVLRLARAAAPWARFDFGVVDLHLLRVQLRPALGFSCYNIATQGVLVLGPRLVLGALMGGSAVAIYAVYATAMRLVDQVFLTLMAPLGVEVSRASGAGDKPQVVRLIALLVQLSTFLFLGVALSLMALGPVVFDWWTHGRVVFQHQLMGLYLCMSAVSLPGRIAAQVLISVNAMRRIALLVLAIALSSLALGAVLVPKLDISGVLAGPICGELAISILLWICLARWLALPFGAMGQRLFDLGSAFNQARAHARAWLGR